MGDAEVIQIASTSSDEANDENEDDFDNRITVPKPLKRAKTVGQFDNEEKPLPLQELENDSDDDSLDGCPICFEPWTSGGIHRVCSLRCGHLFGKQCIETWLCNAARAKCPQCNSPASRKDIRVLFVKKLTALDTTERDALRCQLDQERLEKKRLRDTNTSLNLAYSLAIAELCTLKEEVALLRNASRRPAIGTEFQDFEFKRTVNFGETFKCRSIDFDQHLKMYVLGFSRTQSGTPAHGIAKVSLLDSSRVDYINGVHDNLIKSISCSPFGDELVLSTAFDKTLKLCSLLSNSTLLSYNLEAPGWSCCFDPIDRTKVYAGMANGSLATFDIRNTLQALSIAKLALEFGDLPIHSLQAFPESEEAQKSVMFGNMATLGHLTLLPTGQHEQLGKQSLASYGRCGSVAFERSAPSWIAYCRKSSPQFTYGDWSSSESFKTFSCQSRQTNTVRPSMINIPERETCYLMYPDGPVATMTRMTQDDRPSQQIVMSSNDSQPILDTILSRERQGLGYYWHRETCRIASLYKASLTWMKRSAPEIVPGEVASKRPPYPKRKVAIMMGYCGSNYQGMQLNPNARTIELELFNALCKEGLVSKENAISWMRACRTDKGVHAAGQVVSVKMLVKTKPGGEEGEPEEAALQATVPLLNTILPADIRVFGIKRTANSFHAKERCDSRFYEYLLPTYALAPASPAPYLNPTPRPFADGPVLTASQQRSGNKMDSDDEAERLEALEASEASTEWVSKLTEEEKQLIKEYRVSEERIQLLYSLLTKYKGTHPFHNFTIGKPASDISTRRHIFDVLLGKPFVKEGVEWISIMFHGQSFMLHQIRKMVGLVVMASRLGCDHALIDRCFETSKVNIPKAPSLGLLLDKGIFKAYNLKFGGDRDSIDFDDFSKERQRLKDELIYPKIHAEEMAFNRFMGWLKCNDEHASEFPFLLPFIPKPTSNNIDSN